MAAITPFNFPLNLCVHKVGPALAAGNAVVLKPSERCPATGLLLGALLDECGFPPGAVNVVVGTDPVARRAARPRPAARRRLVHGEQHRRMGHAGEGRPKHVVLELGGNAAVVIDRSADLDDAATRLAEAAFAHAGQVCIKAQRLFVHAEVAGSFRERLLDRIRTHVRAGDPADPLTVVGPMISKEAADRVEGWVAAAAERGAPHHALRRARRQRACPRSSSRARPRARTSTARRSSGPCSRSTPSSRSRRAWRAPTTPSSACRRRSSPPTSTPRCAPRSASPWAP